MADWKPLQRNYEAEKVKHSLRQVQARDHPLLEFRTKQAAAPPSAPGAPAPAPTPAVAKAQVIDPLSGVLDDPLSGMLNDPLSGGGNASSNSPLAGNLFGASPSAFEAEDEELEQQEVSWDIKKQEILREYTVGRIRVKANFLDDSAKISGNDEGSQAEKTAARVESLMGAGGQGTLELSQKEYMDHIQKLHKELTVAWNSTEKVLSLKLAIQCAKLMADVDVPHFYPSCFVLVTEILDTFGTLVYDRIKAKAEEGGSGVPAGKLKHDWMSTDIPAEAKETCRNWFYKTACIRELLPRLFMEISLLRCFRFLADGEYPQILVRLSHMTRGIGDPMIAVYARTYLARGMALVLAEHKDPVISSFYDYLFTFREFEEQKIQSYLHSQQMTRNEYLHLHSPAVEWLLFVLGRGAGKEQFTTVLQHYRGYCNNSMVLYHIIRAFDPKLYCNNAVAMVNLIKESGESKTTHTKVFQALAEKFLDCPPPEDQRLPLLNEVWKVVSKEENLVDYCQCTASFLDLLLKYYSQREVMIILKDLVRHLNTGDTTISTNEDVLKPLERIVRSVVDNAKEDLGTLLTSDHFIAIMAVFKSERKADICKSLLEQFGKTQEPTSDIIIINTLFDLARSLHDSVDSLSEAGERRHISSLICGFVEKIDFGQDLEQQLNVYVDCRGAFANLDSVKDRLVLGVSRLAMRAHGFMQGRHTKKTSAFVKACLAYCHITIPSIDDNFKRLYLLLMCGSVALHNQCLPQTDTFFKAAISLIPEVPEMDEVDHRMVPTEPRLVSYLKCFSAALVVVPGHPEHGPFYLVRGLLNAVQRYAWKPANGGKTEVYVHLLYLLNSYSQIKLPYSVDRVESNDALYGGNQGYMEELSTYITKIMEEILGQLTELGNLDKGKQAMRVLDLVNTIVATMQLNESTVIMTAKLIELASKGKASLGPTGTPYYNNTLKAIQIKANNAVKERASTEQSKGIIKLAQAAANFA